MFPKKHHLWLGPLDSASQRSASFDLRLNHYVPNEPPKIGHGNKLSDSKHPVDTVRSELKSSICAKNRLLRVLIELHT